MSLKIVNVSLYTPKKVSYKSDILNWFNVFLLVVNLLVLS